MSPEMLKSEHTDLRNMLAELIEYDARMGHSEAPIWLRARRLMGRIRRREANEIETR